jgi:hypothetical protein
MPDQSNWRRCQKCNSMFWAGYGGGKCVKGGIHSGQAGQGNDFVLPHSGARAGSQSNWRFCKNCHVMFFNGYAGGQCVAGGPHVADWLDFSLPYGLGFSSADQESKGWRFCGGCHTLFHATRGGGACVAAAGTHSAEGMFTFVLPHADPGEDTPEQRAAVSIAEGLASERGVWPPVKSGDLVDSLTQRIRAPTFVNQSQMMHCAPAAVAYTLARYKPLLYAQTVAALYKTGQATLPGPGGHKLQTSPRLRVAEYAQYFPSTSRPEADWILISSIRNSENWFNIYWGTAGAGTLGAGWVNAITLPDTLMSWLRDFGYTKIKYRTMATQNEDLSVLLEASNLFGNNWRVFLLINREVLYEKTQADIPMSGLPDHYVTLTSLVKFFRDDVDRDGRDEYIEFTCATWGEGARRVPEGSTKLLGRHFVNNFFGFVAATD